MILRLVPNTGTDVLEGEKYVGKLELVTSANIEAMLEDDQPGMREVKYFQRRMIAMLRVFDAGGGNLTTLAKGLGITTEKAFDLLTLLGAEDLFD